jgi:hypothetical protein
VEKSNFEHPTKASVSIHLFDRVGNMLKLGNELCVKINKIVVQDKILKKVKFKIAVDLHFRYYNSSSASQVQFFSNTVIFDKTQTIFSKTQFTNPHTLPKIPKRCVDTDIPYQRGNIRFKRRQNSSASPTLKIELVESCKHKKYTT